MRVGRGSTLNIVIYHAEIRAAPHQAVRGFPEDGALLRPREPQAGGPRPYPFEQHLGDGHPRSWEKPEELGALQRPADKILIFGFVFRMPEEELPQKEHSNICKLIECNT
ncbi:hypothetical protein AV530_004368 [Patagioenas fasciata monilis]|uniref:Uncharacterized protein n=1 Tax=Patagioenas fasciata monilis TaxID=372326 RepID=A0A1V4K9B5_PATFA|nr:hypothetical protein AV530_004368 [Patagioenas fasciata monilis]